MSGLRAVANVDGFQFAGSNPADYLSRAYAQALGDLFGCVGLFEHEITQPTAIRGGAAVGRRLESWLGVRV